MSAKENQGAQERYIASKIEQEFSYETCLAYLLENIQEGLTLFEIADVSGLTDIDIRKVISRFYKTASYDDTDKIKALIKKNSHNSSGKKLSGRPAGSSSFNHVPIRPKRSEVASLLDGAAVDKHHQAMKKARDLKRLGR